MQQTSLKTRAEKIAFLNNLQAGRTSISALVDDTSVSVWYYNAAKDIYKGGTQADEGLLELTSKEFEEMKTKYNKRTYLVMRPAHFTRL